MGSTLERWQEYEISTWVDRPIGVSRIDQRPDIYLQPVTDENEYETFIEHVQSWVPRFTSANGMQIRQMLQEDQSQLWTNPFQHNPELAWRGQACSDWRLASSAQRFSNQGFFDADIKNLPVRDVSRVWIDAEDEVIVKEDALLTRIQSDFDRASFSDIQNLAWAQHEGSKYPGQSGWSTRLLDLTTDPWIALFFATEECSEHPDAECEGRVVVFDDIVQRKVSDLETVVKIRDEIGAIWRPSIQHQNMLTQKGAFLITGLLPPNLRNPVFRLQSLPTQGTSSNVQIGGLSLQTRSIDAEVLPDLATRLQDICIPGIRAAAMGSVLSFMKFSHQPIPPIVTQSVRISGSAKTFFRRILKARGVTRERLFHSDT